MDGTAKRQTSEEVSKTSCICTGEILSSAAMQVGEKIIPLKSKVVLHHLNCDSFIFVSHDNMHTLCYL